MHRMFTTKPAMVKAAKPGYCAFFNAEKHPEYDFLSNTNQHPLDTTYGSFHSADDMYQFLMSEKSGAKWEPLNAMREVLRAKFSNPDLKQKLLETRDAYLVHNGPIGHDRFWSDNGDGRGQNMLGTLLMEMRNELGGSGVVMRPAVLEQFYGSKCDLCTNCCHFSNEGLVFNFCGPHMPRELKLGNCSTPIHLCDLPGGAGRFLYFKTNDHPGLVKEGARLIAERVKELGLKNPFFVTPEASTYSLAHELRDRYHIDGVVICKSRKPGDVETFSIDYCAVTSTEKKKLYVDKSQIDAMRGKDIVILDSIVTTGETLKAVYQLLVKAGVPADKIAESIVLFTEGKNTTSLNIAQGLDLPVHSYSNIPLFAVDPSVDKSRYRLYSKATIPTASHGMNTVEVYQDRTGNSDRDAVVYYPPSVFDHGRENLVVRVQDSCSLCGMLDGALCDCRQQLDQSRDYVARHGGIIIQLGQDGRGLGLGNRLLAYNAQNQGEAGKQKFPEDLRRYDAVPDILKALKIDSIQLMTDNPHKTKALLAVGVKINGTVSCKPEQVDEKKSLRMAS